MTNTRLEQDYGRALGWYPTRWRRTHGLAMLGTLLDVADGEGRSRPAPGELAELRWQGVRERVNAVVPDDVRVLAASIGTGAAAGFALVYLLAVSWVPWGPPPGTAWPDLPAFGPFRNAGVLFAVPILLGALAALGRQRMLAHLAGVLAVLGLVVARITVQATENWNGPGTTTLVTVAALVVVANLGAPRDRRALGIAFGVVAAGLALFAGLQLPTGHPFESTLFGDSGLWGTAVNPALLGVVGVLVLVTVVELVRGRHGVLAAALAVAWLPWAVAGTITLRYFAAEDAASVLMAVGSTLMALTALVIARRVPQRSRRERA
ncbi:hypothetical protein E9228_000045 [Curtobacterium flaccumfaciens]|uniref:Uncharacterized protein n=1 Tax=Curtobacterium salicis TaxID=1779862 RepID=A0ABX0T4L9_9MICO|nr:DUF4337 domain-containing protein [Curtobacterium sp. WW7]NII39426.1 hypothetical protein [Curtobacterium sp. WW7]